MVARVILRYLRVVETHIAQGDQQIEQQAEIIAQLEGENQETALAREYLTTMKMLQVTRGAIRDRLMKELLG